MRTFATIQLDTIGDALERARQQLAHAVEVGDVAEIAAMRRVVDRLDTRLVEAEVRRGRELHPTRWDR